MDLYLPDDLKQWLDALDARDIANQRLLAAQNIYAITAAAQEAAYWVDVVDQLRKEHACAGNACLIEPREESGFPDLVTGTYNEDVFHDNRERLRNIK